MNNIQKIIGHTYKDTTLLTTALTHTSYANDNNTTSYERLEYLGDALLDFVVAEFLYNNFSDQVGNLSKFRAKLVNADILSGLIVSLGLDKFVLTGKSVQKVSSSIYADVFESILASIYLDQGDYKKFVVDKLLIDVEHVNNILNEFVDYKTQFQELMQQCKITYKYTNKKVDDMFEVQLIVAEKVVSTSTANSIKQAEQNCAKSALTILSKKA